MFRSYSSVDFGTKPGDKKKHFKQKHFHPEGEATSRPVKSKARQFLGGLQTLGICIIVELVGEAVQFCTSFSPSIKKEGSWRQRSNHSMRILVTFPTKRREENRTF